MLTVILAVRDTPQSAANCLGSLTRTVEELGLARGVEFVLIDDASAPQSGIPDLFRSFRRAAGGAPVRIVRCRSRQHYNHVVALGLSLAQGDLALFVSHDMIVTPDYVQTLLRVAPLDATYGIVRGTSTHVDGFPQHVVRPPLPLRRYEDVADFSRYVARYWGLATVQDDFLIGDSMLVKRSVIDRIGVFDTRAYGFLGDIDYGLRAQRAGFRLVCAKGSWLFHEGGQMRGEVAEAPYQSVHESVMAVVRAAYRKFRQKWGAFLPEEYPAHNFLELNFDELRRVPPPPGGEFQPPLALDGSVHEEL